MEKENKLQMTEEQAEELKEIMCSCESETTDDELKILVEPLILEGKELTKYLHSTASFKEGFEKGAYIGGIYAGLINSGFDIMAAIETAVGMASLEKQKEIQLAIAETAKVVAITKEKEEI